MKDKDKDFSHKADSERNRPEIELSEWMIQLLETLPLAVFFIRNRTVISVNSRAANMLDVRLEDVVGKNLSEFILREDISLLLSLLSTPEQSNKFDEKHVCRFVNANNNIVWAEITCSEVKLKNEKVSIIFSYDITEYKEAEIKRREFMELARRQEDQLIHSTRLAELGEMAAAIAHELKQPLTGIRNFARNAYYMIEKDAGSPDEIKNNLRLISEQVDRAARIINQMRDLTRKSEPHFVTMDINATIKDSLDFLLPQLALSEVEVNLELSPGIPYIKGDRLRLEQVFLNIITNARQAMDNVDKKKLDIFSYVDRESDCPVVVEFQDSGVGFSDDVADKLFTAFYSTKKPGQGTGLGLSISMRIIREHNGRIEAESEPGKGARFIIRLPISGGVKQEAQE